MIKDQFFHFISPLNLVNLCSSHAKSSRSWVLPICCFKEPCFFFHVNLIEIQWQMTASQHLGRKRPEFSLSSCKVLHLPELIIGDHGRHFLLQNVFSFLISPVMRLCYLSCRGKHQQSHYCTRWMIMSKNSYKIWLTK